MSEKILFNNNKTRDFKFHKKGETFIWENHMFRIVFSEPRIQGFSEYKTIKDVKGIMYFYYSVEVYRSEYYDYDEGNDEPIYQWVKVMETYTHDFPCITQLDWILEYMLSLDTRENGEKHEYRSGYVEYSRHFCSEGFGCDDFYELTKFVNEKGQKANYIFYVGCATDNQSTLESAGVRIPRLSTKDIKQLQKCVSSFLDYAINYHNEVIKERLHIESNNKEIIENKLYKYNGLAKEKIEDIYIIGDKMEIDFLTEDGVCENKKIVIKNFTHNSVISEDNEEYLLDKIVHIFEDMSEEKLHYNMKQVENDFYSIMTDYEKEKFLNQSIMEIYEEYSSAIIGRTWMCRTEHPFPKFIEDTGYHENVNLIVKMIIHNIKERLMVQQ